MRFFVIFPNTHTKVMSYYIQNISKVRKGVIDGRLRLSKPVRAENV